jgi:hypothetical protein
MIKKEFDKHEYDLRLYKNGSISYEEYIQRTKDIRPKGQTTIQDVVK